MITSLLDQEINFSYQRRRLMQEAAAARLANKLRTGNVPEPTRTREVNENWYRGLARSFRT